MRRLVALLDTCLRKRRRHVMDMRGLGQRDVVEARGGQGRTGRCSLGLGRGRRGIEDEDEGRG